MFTTVCSSVSLVIKLPDTNRYALSTFCSTLKASVAAPALLKLLSTMFVVASRPVVAHCALVASGTIGITVAPLSTGTSRKRPATLVYMRTSSSKVLLMRVSSLTLGVIAVTPTVFSRRSFMYSVSSPFRVTRPRIFAFKNSLP